MINKLVLSNIEEHSQIHSLVNKIKYLIKYKEEEINVLLKSLQELDIQLKSLEDRMVVLYERINLKTEES